MNRADHKHIADMLKHILDKKLKNLTVSDKKWLDAASNAMVALMNEDAESAITILSSIGEHEAADFIRMNGCNIAKFMANSRSFRNVTSSH
jgi:hypothetical protein